MKQRKEKSGKEKFSITALPVAKADRKTGDELRQEIQDIWLVLEDLASRIANAATYIGEVTQPTEPTDPIYPITYTGLAAIDITGTEVSLLINNTGNYTDVTQSDTGIKVDVETDTTLTENPVGELKVYPPEFLVMCDDEESGGSSS